MNIRLQSHIQNKIIPAFKTGRDYFICLSEPQFSLNDQPPALNDHNDGLAGVKAEIFQSAALERERQRCLKVFQQQDRKCFVTTASLLVEAPETTGSEPRPTSHADKIKKTDITEGMSVTR